MKNLISALLSACALVLLFAGCENIINTETNITVTNSSGENQTFSLYDTNGSELKGTYTIANAATETYTVRRGYSKSTPAKCVWEYSGGVWMIKSAQTQKISATNNLPITVKLIGDNIGGVSSEIGIQKDTTVEISVYNSPHNWRLKDQVEFPPNSGNYYVLDSGKKYFFEIKHFAVLAINLVKVENVAP